MISIRCGLFSSCLRVTNSLYLVYSSLLNQVFHPIFIHTEKEIADIVDEMKQLSSVEELLREVKE